MAYIEDDLDYNPFYKALQNEYCTFFNQAQKRCCLICVPQSSALSSTSHFAQSFIESHILQKSPYYKGQFVSSNTDDPATYKIEAGAIIDKGGFPVKILFEELGYNQNYEQFRILVLERPLSNNLLPKVTAGIPVQFDPLEPKVTVAECKRFLYSFKECRQVMSQLETSVRQFMKNYMVVKGYLEDAAAKLRAIAKETNRMFLSELRLSLAQHPRAVDNVGQSIESYLLDATHSKLWAVLLQDQHNQDKHLIMKFNQLQQCNQTQLGISEQLSCSTTAAVMKISSLDGQSTPLEKMLCIKATLDCITESVNSHILQSKHSAIKEDSLCLTSDDYITLLVSVLVQAKPAHLASNIYYIELFHWSASSKDNLRFTFVTLKAAVEYITTVDVSKLLGHSGQTELSLDHMGTEVEKSVEEAASTPVIPQQPKSRRQRQLDRINKMLQDTSLASENSPQPS